MPRSMSCLIAVQKTSALGFSDKVCANTAPKRGPMNTEPSQKASKKNKVTRLVLKKADAAIAMAAKIA